MHTNDIHSNNSINSMYMSSRYVYHNEKERLYFGRYNHNTSTIEYTVNLNN